MVLRCAKSDSIFYRKNAVCFGIGNNFFIIFAFTGNYINYPTVLDLGSAAVLTYNTVDGYGVALLRSNFHSVITERAVCGIGTVNSKTVAIFINDIHITVLSIVYGFNNAGYIVLFFCISIVFHGLTESDSFFDSKSILLFAFFAAIDLIEFGGGPRSKDIALTGYVIILDIVHSGASGFFKRYNHTVFAINTESLFIENESKTVVIALFIVFNIYDRISHIVVYANYFCFAVNKSDVNQSGTCGVSRFCIDPNTKLCTGCQSSIVIFLKNAGKNFSVINYNEDIYFVFKIVNLIPEIGCGLFIPLCAELLDDTNVYAVNIGECFLVGFIVSLYICSSFCEEYETVNERVCCARIFIATNKLTFGFSGAYMTVGAVNVSLEVNAYAALGVCICFPLESGFSICNSTVGSTAGDGNVTLAFNKEGVNGFFTLNSSYNNGNCRILGILSC